MAILALGVNHQSAPVELRERVSIAPDSTVPALQDLHANTGIDEAAILSTCNRTELYLSSDHSALKKVAQWLHSFQDLPQAHLEPYLYLHQDDAAVRHILRVAAGLDSMVLGEPEILGQMKQAYKFAQAASTLSRPMARLFEHSFTTAKRVRTQTEIGAHPVSVAYTAITLAKRVFGDLEEQSVMMVGAGETIELTARHLREQHVRQMIVANRTLSNAQALANRMRASAISLHELPEHLHKADILITSTGSQQPIISQSMLESASKSRKHKPMLAIDLAVPRDIEAGAAELPDVYLYTIDNLKDVAEQNMNSRRAAAADAEAIIETQVDNYMLWLREQNAAFAIRSIRAEADAEKERHIEKAKRALARGANPEEVVDALAHQLTQKLLHNQTSGLRKLAAKERPELLNQIVETLQKKS